MKKALFSFTLAAALIFGAGLAFAAPPQRPMNEPPRILKQQPPKQLSKYKVPSRQVVVVQKNRHIAPPPPKHKMAPPPPLRIVHKPHKKYIAHKPYYNNYNKNFALKVGNLFLSI